MDLRKLKKLIDLVEESGITELEVTEGEEKVRIAKNPNVVAQQAYMVPQAAPIAGAAPVRARKSSVVIALICVLVSAAMSLVAMARHCELVSAARSELSNAAT